MKRLLVLAAAVMLSVGLLATIAEAAKTTGTVSAPVNLDGGEINHGDHVRFDVVTDAQYPDLSVECVQDGAVVYRHGGYLRGVDPSTRVFTLSSSHWTGGEADCTATLRSVNPRNFTYKTLAETDFHVVA